MVKIGIIERIAIIDLIEQIDRKPAHFTKSNVSFVFHGVVVLFLTVIFEKIFKNQHQETQNYLIHVVIFGEGVDVIKEIVEIFHFPEYQISLNC